MHRFSKLFHITGLGCLLALLLILPARADEARQLVPWLDLPASWTGTEAKGVVSLSPDDLSFFDSLILMVEPLSTSGRSLDDEYAQAVRDLGPWRPVGNPVEQRFDNGWVFRFGVGVATLNGTQYTGEIAVARHGNQRVRFWELADSDGTFNRYKNVVATAMSSAQDIKLKKSPPTASSNHPAPAAQGGAGNFKLAPGFGKGISGVYIGFERGVSAHAGYGIGDVSTSVEDYTDINVFFPDGTYRHRLPDRGMNSDLRWDQQTWKPLWGTWKQQGNKVVISYSGYTTAYSIGKNNTLISDRDRPWRKIPIPTHVRVEGTFVRANWHDADAPRITLHADGRYEEHGNFLHSVSVSSPSNLIKPDGYTMVSRWNQSQLDRAMSASNGTYTFDSFTMTFHTNDGRIWQINAYVPPGESMTNPKNLVISGVPLVKE